MPDNMKNEMNKKFTARDAIQVGLYGALLFFLSGIAGSIGFIPILYPIAPFFIAIVCGPIFFLFLSKVRHFGMVSATSILQGAFLAITGHGIYSLIAAIMIGLLADFICKQGDYRHFKQAALAYGLYSLIMATSYLPMLLSTESYYHSIATSMNVEYAQQLRNIMQGPVFILVFVLAFVGGILGAFLGRAVAQKHFLRAGVFK